MPRLDTMPSVDAAAPSAGVNANDSAGGVTPPARVATAKSAHEGMVATLIVIVVVYLLVIVAGMSKGAGRAVLAFFGLAIVIQGLGHTGSVTNWVISHPLTPKGK